jgi:hypothetical protein
MMTQCAHDAAARGARCVECGACESRVKQGVHGVCFSGDMMRAGEVQ